MAYCKTEDVKSMLKDDVINSIIGENRLLDELEKERLLTPILVGAVSDATAEIEGYLNKRYPIPLFAVPPMIEKLAKDIAVYNIMSRSGIDAGERESNYLTRYNAAIKYLTMAAEGKVDIGLETKVPSGNGKSNSTFYFTNNEAIFSRKKMQGM
ncbi:MAG: DUF1320 domain-containing protein [Anaerovorax sp.]